MSTWWERFWAAKRLVDAIDDLGNSPDISFGPMNIPTSPTPTESDRQFEELDEAQKKFDEVFKDGEGTLTNG
ncbi:unnamed protein product [Adineta steineri]|uniref:Uncharacterized protein n=1 Tax=Adineta steineri TaxID=433720 RepID=A0A819PYI7_9BILA|nr:unnamed protein product [Adineta steineri]